MKAGHALNAGISAASQHGFICHHTITFCAFTVMYKKKIHSVKPASIFKSLGMYLCLCVMGVWIPVAMLYSS